MASILCRSGCRGEPSTEQPMTFEELLPPDNVHPYVIIKHAMITLWIERLREIGYKKVVAICPIRDPIATKRSAVKCGHYTTEDAANIGRTERLWKNILEAAINFIDFEIVPYECLNEDFLKAWLPTIGLEYVPGPLELPGQIAPDTIINQNAKHYAT